jgi:hypothetical protein
MTGKQLLKKFEKAVEDYQFARLQPTIHTQLEIRTREYKVKELRCLIHKLLKELGNIHIDKLGNITAPKGNPVTVIQGNARIKSLQEFQRKYLPGSKCKRCSEDIGPQGACACTGYYNPVGNFNRDGITCAQQYDLLGDGEAKALGIPESREIFAHWKLRQEKGIKDAPSDYNKRKK